MRADEVVKGKMVLGLEHRARMAFAESGNQGHNFEILNP